MLAKISACSLVANMSIYLKQFRNLKLSEIKLIDRRVAKAQKK